MTIMVLGKNDKYCSVGLEADPDIFMNEVYQLSRGGFKSFKDINITQQKVQRTFSVRKTYVKRTLENVR